MSKLVLAYSGGLDTSYCAKYLSKEKGYEVHAVSVNTGGFSPAEIQDIEEKALKLGAASYTSINAVQTFYDKVVKYLKQHLSALGKCRTHRPGHRDRKTRQGTGCRLYCPWQYRRGKRPGAIRHDFPDPRP